MTASPGQRLLLGTPSAGSARPAAAGAAAAGAAAAGPGVLSAGPGPVRIRLLGRFAVQRDSADVPLSAFGGRLAQRLLRLLALRRGALVSKDVIAEALWPAGRPANARANIEVLVSRIRRALGDRALVQTGTGGYVLTDDGRCEVDAEAFLAAVGAGRARLAAEPAAALEYFRDALRLWRGEPLAEDAYAAWAHDDRRYLTLAFLEALEGAAAAALAVGDHAEAVSRAWQALARDPLLERAAMLLVQALAASGDQAGALAAFDSFRQRLASEAGLDPSPAAQAVRQRVLLGKPPDMQEPEPPGGAATARALPETFVGREGECSLIAAAAAGTGPRLVQVTGPAGVGKSRLLAEAARLALVPVLSAQARPGDRDDPWALAGRLLRQARDMAGTAGVDLEGPEAEALAELVLGPALPAAAAARGPAREDRRALTVRAAVRLVEAAARPRCLVVIDNLNWADQESLGLLGRLLRRVDRISVAAAYRPDVPEAGWSAAEALGVPAAEARQLTLGPLSPDAIRGLLADPVLAEMILEQAASTPFEATEIVAALARRGTLRWDAHGLGRLHPRRDAARTHETVAAGLGDALAARLEAMPARQRQLLCLLAMLGQPASPALLAEASGAELREVLTCLEALGRARMTGYGSQGCGLRGEALGGAIAGTLGPAEKAHVHGLLARALQRAGADPADVAAHLLESGDREAAAAAYAAGSSRRLERLSDAEAMQLAEAGLSVEPVGRARGMLLEARAEVHCRRGQCADARADLASALDSLTDAGDRARVLAELAVIEARSVALARGEQLIELAIAEAGEQPGALGQALTAGAIIDLPAGNLRRAQRRFRRARQLLERAGDSRAAARQLYWQAMVSFIDGRLREAVTQLGHLAHLPVAPAEMLRFWSPGAALGHALAFLGEAPAGLEEIDQVLARARPAGYRALECECLWRRGEALAFLGRAGQAIESAQQAEIIAARIDHAACIASSLRGLGIAWEAAGRLDRAEPAYRRSLHAAAGNSFFAAWASARLGACLARQGHPQDAAEHVAAAMAGGTRLTCYEARWAHAELLAARGDDRACRAAATGALRAAEDGGYLILVPRLRELAGL